MEQVLIQEIKDLYKSMLEDFKVWRLEDSNNSICFTEGSNDLQGFPLQDYQEKEQELGRNDDQEEKSSGQIDYFMENDWFDDIEWITVIDLEAEVKGEEKVEKLDNGFNKEGVEDHIYMDYKISTYRNDNINNIKTNDLKWSTWQSEKRIEFENKRLRKFLLIRVKKKKKKFKVYKRTRKKVIEVYQKGWQLAEG